MANTTTKRRTRKAPAANRKYPDNSKKAAEQKYIENENIASGLIEAPVSKPGPKNFGCENAKPGDNARYLRHALASWNLPPIDISDPVQVENRLMQYFEYCVENDRKPNMVGMSNWLGISRDTLNSWKRGEYRTSTHSDLVQKAIKILEEQWVDYMLNGKVNPASAIFIGKNLFGYKDVQDVVVTPNNPLGDAPTEDQIRERIEGNIVSDYSDDVEY